MSHPSVAVLSQFLTASRNPLRPLRDMPSAIDEFCTGNSDEIKEVAVLSKVRRALDETLHFNIQDILREAFRATRADMSTAEKKQFYDRYIRNMKIVIAPNGEVAIELGR